MADTDCGYWMGQRVMAEGWALADGLMVKVCWWRGEVVADRLHRKSATHENTGIGERTRSKQHH